MDAIRRYVKSMPVIGPAMRNLYLRAFRKEGEAVQISSGLWMKRFMATYQESYRTGQYEPPIVQALRETLRAGDTFYDVGANAGYFSLIAAQEVGPAGRVFAFEPHPATAKMLRAQFKLNRLENCVVVEAAVSDSAGAAEFTDDQYSGMQYLIESSYGEDRQESKRRIIVKTLRLDEFASESGTGPAVIKMDIEGAELDALAGAHEILTRLWPVLLVELHSDDIHQRYLSLMRSLGYETRYLVEAETRFVLSRRAA